MTVVLSPSAIGALARKRLSSYGAQPRTDLVDWLERAGVERARAESAIDLALIRGRLRETPGDEGPVLTAPRTWDEIRRELPR